MESTAKVGLIGLGVMGENLALNIERNGYSIAVYNRHPDKVDEFMNGRAAGKIQPRLIDQSSCLQRISGLFMPHVSPGNSVQLVVDQRSQPLERSRFAFAPGLQQLRDALG